MKEKVNLLIVLLFTVFPTLAFGYGSLLATSHQTTHSEGAYSGTRNEAGWIEIGQRTANQGNGWCNLYRTYLLPDGTKTERWVAYYGCDPGR